MDEKEIEIIKKETHKLLEDFSKMLDKIKSGEESNVIRDEDRRKDGEGKEPCSEESIFRKTMLENAPVKSENFIIAEKKSW